MVYFGEDGISADTDRSSSSCSAGKKYHFFIGKKYQILACHQQELFCGPIYSHGSYFLTSQWHPLFELQFDDRCQLLKQISNALLVKKKMNDYPHIDSTNHYKYQGFEND